MLHRPHGRFTIEPEFLAADPPHRVILPRASSSPALARIGALTSRYSDDEEDDENDTSGNHSVQERQNTHTRISWQADASVPSDYSADAEVRDSPRSISMEHLAGSVKVHSTPNDNWKPTPAPRFSQQQSTVQSSVGSDRSVRLNNEAQRRPKSDYGSILARRVIPNLGGTPPRATVSSLDLRDLSRSDNPDRKGHKQVSFEDLTAPLKQDSHSNGSSQSQVSGWRKFDVCGSVPSHPLERSFLDDHPTSKDRPTTVSTESPEIFQITRKTPPINASSPTYAGSLETYLESKRKRRSLDGLRLIPFVSSPAGATADASRQTGCSDSTLLSSTESVRDSLDVASPSLLKESSKSTSPTLFNQSWKSSITQFDRSLSNDPNKIFERNPCPPTSTTSTLSAPQRDCANDTGGEIEESFRSQPVPSEQRSLFKSYSIVDPPCPPSNPPPGKTDSRTDFKMSSRYRSLTNLHYLEGLAKTPTPSPRLSLASQYRSLNDVRADTPLASPRSTASMNKVHMIEENPIRRTAEISEMFTSNRDRVTMEFSRPSPAVASDTSVKGSTKNISQKQEEVPPPLPSVPPPEFVQGLVFSPKDEVSLIKTPSRANEDTNLNCPLEQKQPLTSNVAKFPQHERISQTDGEVKPRSGDDTAVPPSALSPNKGAFTRSDTDVYASFSLGMYRDGSHKVLERTNSLSILQSKDKPPAKVSKSEYNISKGSISASPAEPMLWTSRISAPRQSCSPPPTRSNNATDHASQSTGSPQQGVKLDEASFSKKTHSVDPDADDERPLASDSSPKSCSAILSQPGAVALTHLMDVKAPPKPQRGNRVEEHLRGGTLPRNMGSSKNPFGSDEVEDDEVILRKSRTLDMRAGSRSSAGSITSPVGTRLITTYPKTLDPFEGLNDDSDQEDDFDNLDSFSAGPSRCSTLSRDGCPEGNNPFGTDNEEADVESLASTTFTSYSSRNAFPLRASTPVGKTTRKFGGWGLTSVWSPPHVQPPSPDVHDNSLNPFTESDSESVASMASSSVVSAASITKGPPVPPRRHKEVRKAGVRKKRAPPPPILSEAKPVPTETSVMSGGDLGTIGDSDLSKISPEGSGACPAVEERQADAGDLKESDPVVQLEDTACGGDMPTTEEILKKLTVTEQRDCTSGGDHSDSPENSSVDLDISRPFPPLPPLPHEIQEPDCASETIQEPTVPKQGCPAETPAGSTNPASVKESTGDNTSRNAPEMSLNEDSCPKAVVTNDNQGTSAEPDESDPQMTQANSVPDEHLTPATEKYVDTKSESKHPPPKPLKKNTLEQQQRRRAPPAPPTQTSPPIIMNLPEKEDNFTNQMNDKKSKSSSSQSKKGSNLNQQSRLPLAIHPMLAFPNPLVGTSDDLDTDANAGDVSWTDTSSTSYSDLEQDDILEESHMQKVIGNELGRMPEQHVSLVEHDHSLNQRNASGYGDPIDEAVDNHDSSSNLKDADQEADYNAADRRDTTVIPSGKTGKKQPVKRQSSKAACRRGKQRRRTTRPVVIKYIYHTAMPEDITEADSSENADSLNTPASASECPIEMSSEVKSAFDSAPTPGGKSAIEISLGTKDSLTATAQPIQTSDFDESAESTVHSDEVRSEETDNTNGKSELSHVDEGESMEARPSQIPQSSSEDITIPETGKGELSHTSPFVISPSVIPPPEFDFQDPAGIVQTMQFPAAVDVVTTEEFEIHQNDLPDVGSDWDEYASTSDSSFVSEEDTPETAEDILMNLRRTQRALSVILEDPEEESDEERSHRVSLSTNLDDEFLPTYDLVNDLESPSATQQQQKQQQQEVDRAKLDENDMVDPDGTLFYSQEALEDTEEFEVHRMDSRTDADEDFDTADEGDPQGMKVALRPDIPSISNSNRVYAGHKTEKPTQTSESKQCTTESTISDPVKNAHIVQLEVNLSEDRPHKGEVHTNGDALTKNDSKEESTPPVTEIIVEEDQVIAPASAASTNVLDGAQNEQKTIDGTNDTAFLEASGAKPNDYASALSDESKAAHMVTSCRKAEDIVVQKESITTEISSEEPLSTTPAAPQGSTKDVAPSSGTSATVAPSAGSSPSAVEFKIEVLDNSFEDDDEEDDVVTNLNRMLLQESVRRRAVKTPVTPLTPSLEMESFAPYEMGSLEDLSTPTGHPRLDLKPKAKALPLPPMDLISRRYSAGDVLAYPKTIQSLRTAATKSRSSSISVLIPRTRTGEVVTQKLVAVPSSEPDDEDDAATTTASQSEVTPPQDSNKLHRSSGIRPSLPSTPPPIERLRRPSERPSRKVPPPVPRRPPLEAGSTEKPLGPHRHPFVPPRAVTLPIRTEPARAVDLDVKVSSTISSPSQSCAPITVNRPAPPIPKPRPKNLTESLQVQSQAVNALADHSSTPSHTVPQKIALPKVPPPPRFVSSDPKRNNFPAITSPLSDTAGSNSLRTPPGSVPRKSLAERFVEAQAANNMKPPVITVPSHPIAGARPVPPRPAPPKPLSLVPSRPVVNKPGTPVSPSGYSSINTILEPPQMPSDTVQPAGSSRSETVSATSTNTTLRTAPELPGPLRPAPRPPPPKLSHTPPPTPIESRTSLEAENNAGPSENRQISRRLSEPIFPLMLPPPSEMNSERRPSLQSARFRPPPPMTGPTPRNESRQTDPASTQSTAPSTSETTVSPLRQPVQAQPKDACNVTPPSVSLPSISSSSREASAQSQASPDQRSDVGANHDASGGLSSTTTDRRELQSGPSYEEETRGRSRTLSENEAERILGRAVDFSVEEDRLSHQKRVIEEKQANLSAEARLIERQLWESAKAVQAAESISDSPINSDYPRVVLDQSIGKYYMSNEENVEMFREDLVADLYRILNMKNQLSDKYTQLKFLQSYNDLQRDQLDIEARLRNLANSPNGSTASMSFVDSNYERVLMHRLMEVISQRSRLVEMMDEQHQRKTALGDLSHSLSDLSLDSLSSMSMKSSKSLSSLDKIGHGNAKRKKKRRGVKHFLKKRYNSFVKKTTSLTHGSGSHDRTGLTD